MEKCIENPFKGYRNFYSSEGKNIPRFKSKFLCLEIDNIKNLKRLNLSDHNSLRFSRVLTSLVYHAYDKLASYTFNIVASHTSYVKQPLEPQITVTEYKDRNTDAPISSELFDDKNMSYWEYNLLIEPKKN